MNSISRVSALAYTTMDLRDFSREGLPDSSNDTRRIPFRTEEQCRPWTRRNAAFGDPPPNGALWSLRVWDDYSQGLLDPQSGCILATGEESRLDTKDERRESLKPHANNRDWSRRSPFISASTSASSTRERARRRVRNRRDPVRVSLINNMVRVRAGFPFFSAVEEMKYYGVEDPYNRSFLYGQDEILYPYVITSEEIVCTWQWSDIESYLETHSGEEWVANIELKFDQHERLSLARQDELYPTFR